MLLNGCLTMIHSMHCADSLEDAAFEEIINSLELSAIVFSTTVPILDMSTVVEKTSGMAGSV